MNEVNLNHLHLSPRLLFQNLQSGVIVYAEDSRIVYANPCALELLRLTEDQALGRVPMAQDWNLIDESGKTLELANYPVNRVLASQQALAGVVVGVVDGVHPAPTWVLINAYLDIEAAVRHVIVTVANISDRLNINFRQVVDLADDIVLVTEAAPLDSPGTRIIYANKAFESLTGYAVEEVIGKSPRILQGPLTSRAALDRIKAALLKGEPIREVVLNYTKYGGQYWLDINISPIKDHYGMVTHFVAIERDVTAAHGETTQLRHKAESAINSLRIANAELAYQSDEKGKRAAELVRANVELAYQNEEKSKRADELVIANLEMAKNKKIADEVWKLSFYDPLTGLPNRRLLSDRMRQVMASSKRTGCYIALMMLDLDKFKSLNDLHGHAMGDALLQEVSRRLLLCVRAMDTVARFGGDEFVVLLGELNKDKTRSVDWSMQVAEKIRLELAQPYHLPTPSAESGERTVAYSCTVSVGIAVFLNHSGMQDDILNSADAAMYQAKAAGRNEIRLFELTEQK